VLAPRDAEAVADQVAQIDQVPDIRALTARLVTGRP
jgi:hypothetical protein